MENIFGYTAFLIFIYMVCWFVLAIIRKNSGIVDIAWGLGFTLVAWAGFINFAPASNTVLILVLMVSLWGFRLALHIFLRGLGQPEDWRYKAWRDQWGNTFIYRTFLQVFMLQGFFMWVIALPLMTVISSDQSITFPGIGEGDNNILNSLCLVIGFLVWLLGFLWESIADYQLFSFKKDPANKGKILTTGLWSLSRHPNYFGEVVLWWGIFIFCIPFGKWWIAIASPIVITWLLLRVSGVPMLERKYKTNSDYKAYVDSTNAFSPWPKK